MPTGTAWVCMSYGARRKVLSSDLLSSLSPILCDHLWATLKIGLSSLYSTEVSNEVVPWHNQVRSLFFWPRDTTYSLKPVASSIDGDVAVFDVNTIQVEKPLSTGITWYDAFRYPLEYSSDDNPISAKRALRGSSQAWGQLETVIMNRSPVMVQVIYVETMPWLLTILSSHP